ncbi:MAG: type II toxin-antitoxin system MqsA family antitoxin [Methylococcaceae bacterium]
MSNKCAKCGSSNFDIYIESDDFVRNGQSFNVDVEHSVCHQCGDMVIFSEQIKRNDCVLRDAWRKIDGLLTAQEIVALRNTLGLTQQDAAKIFGGGPNAFSKYERSEVIQSVAMDKLMRAALAVPGMFIWLKQQAGFHLKKQPAPDYDNIVPITHKIIADLQTKSHKPLFSEHDDYHETANYG